MPTHRAIRVPSPGASFGLASAGTGSPPPGHVRIDVAACGVCGTGSAFIVAGEPTASLNVSTAAEIAGLLRLTRQSGAEIALVSHDEVLLAAVAGRIVRVRDGLTTRAERPDDVAAGGADS